MAVVLLAAQVFAFGASAQSEVETKSACAAISGMSDCTSLSCPMHRRTLPQLGQQMQPSQEQSATEAKPRVFEAVALTAVAVIAPTAAPSKTVALVEEAQVALHTGPPDRLMALRV